MLLAMAAGPSTTLSLGQTCMKSPTSVCSVFLQLTFRLIDILCLQFHIYEYGGIYCTLCVPYTVSVSGINLMYWDLSNPATAGNSDHVCSDWSLKPACVVVPCMMV